MQQGTWLHRGLGALLMLSLVSSWGGTAIAQTPGPDSNRSNTNRSNTDRPNSNRSNRNRSESNRSEGERSNFLEPTTERDPLLPRLQVERPLTPLERSDLRAALDGLSQQAEALRQAGNLTGAVELWGRELRLRRYLGPMEEVEALRRVGAIVWQDSLSTETQQITQRLQQIEQDTRKITPPDFVLLQKIAEAYQTLRAYQPAVTLYNQQLQQARATGDRDNELQTLKALAALHFAWFNYDQAATTYQELLAIAQAQQDETAQTETLQQLAFVYQQARQPELAIAVLQQLIELHQRQQQILQIVPLRLALGDQYRALNRNREAAASYQEAFALARTTQQAGFAGDALERLGDLYVAIDRPNDAITVYRLLLDVHRLSYNWLGMMNTFADIGRLYRQGGDRPNAIFAFQQALQLAQQLDYRRKVNQFSRQIQELSQTVN